MPHPAKLVKALLFAGFLSVTSLSSPAQADSIAEQPGNLIDLGNIRIFDPDNPVLRPSEQPSTAPATEPAVNPTEKPLRLEISRSRRQVTLYRGDTAVKKYPIAVGRPGWETPLGTFKVRQKFKNPTWVHPLEKGVVIPGGDPENPLGRYWIGFWTDGKNWIGFHGTPNPKSVGRPASHGCIRMYNKDVEELFQQVSLGTVVTVIR